MGDVAGVIRRPIVVPLESFADVVGDPHSVVEVAVASKNVDESRSPMPCIAQ